MSASVCTGSCRTSCASFVIPVFALCCLQVAIMDDPVESWEFPLEPYLELGGFGQGSDAADNAWPSRSLASQKGAEPQDMSSLLAKFQIPVELHKELSAFSPSEFGMVATSLTALDDFLNDLPYAVDGNLALTKARIRLLWKHCQPDPVTSSPATAPVAPASSATAADSDWTHVFPKKLSVEQVRLMKARFVTRYPSEPLAPDTMPGPRLLAVVAKQLSEKSWRHVPWKIRLSEEQYEQRMAERPHKVPKLELIAVDDQPQRDLSQAHMSKSVMSEVLELHSTAIALCGGAHLHTLRDLNRRFLARAFERYSSESGLRAPSWQESLIADQKLWTSVATLMNDDGWTMEAALREVVVVRNEVATLLMPRPFVPKIPLVGNGLCIKERGRKREEASTAMRRVLAGVAASLVCAWARFIERMGSRSCSVMITAGLVSVPRDLPASLSICVVSGCRMGPCASSPILLPSISARHIRDPGARLLSQTWKGVRLMRYLSNLVLGRRLLGCVIPCLT